MAGRYNRDHLRLIPNAKIEEFCRIETSRESAVVVQSLKKRFNLTYKQARTQYDNYVKTKWAEWDGQNLNIDTATRKTEAETQATISDEEPAALVSKRIAMPKLKPETVNSASPMPPGKYDRSAFRLISEAEMDRFCCTQRNRERSVVVQSLKKKFGLTSRQANSQYENHVKPRWNRHNTTVTETHSTVSDEAPAEMVSRPSDTPKSEPEAVISAVAVKTEESVYDMDTDDDVDFEHWTGNDDDDDDDDAAADDDEGSLHLENIVEV